MLEASAQEGHLLRQERDGLPGLRGEVLPGGPALRRRAADRRGPHRRAAPAVRAFHEVRRGLPPGLRGDGLPVLPVRRLPAGFPGHPGGGASAAVRKETERRRKERRARLPGPGLQRLPASWRRGRPATCWPSCATTTSPATCAPPSSRGCPSLRAAWLLVRPARQVPRRELRLPGPAVLPQGAFFYRWPWSGPSERQRGPGERLQLRPRPGQELRLRGFLYMTGLLQFRYGPRKDRERRARMLEEARRAVSKLFGTGQGFQATSPRPCWRSPRASTSRSARRSRTSRGRADRWVRRNIRLTLAYDGTDFCGLAGPGERAHGAGGARGRRSSGCTAIRCGCGRPAAPTRGCTPAGRWSTSPPTWTPSRRSGSGTR